MRPTGAVPARSPDGPRAESRWLDHLAMATLFTAAVLVGRATRMGETGLALIWPAAGVGVLWVALARGRHRLVASGLLAVLAGVLNGVTGAGLGVGAALGAANALQAWVWCRVTCTVQRRLGREPLRVRGPADLIAGTVAALVAAVLGALVAGTALAVADHTALAPLIGQWVARNAVGILVVGAPALVLADPARARLGDRRPRQVVEAAVAVLAAAAVYLALFATVSSPAAAFLVLPVGIVVAERYGAATGGAYTLVSGTVVVWCTLVGVGPLAVPNPHEAAFLAQALVGASSAITLALALRNEERHAARGAAEEAQRQTQRQAGLLNTIVETTPHAIVVYDRDGSTLHSNAAARRLLGDTSDDRWTQRFDRLDPDGSSRPVGESLSAGALGGEQPADVDLVERDCADPVYLSAAATPVPGDAEDATGGAILTVRDVTGARRVEQEVREARDRLADSEQRFRLAFGTAPITMLILDAAGRSAAILEANATASTFTGHPAEELHERTLHDLVHPEDRGTTRRWFTRLVRDPEAQSPVEVRFVTADAQTHWGVLSARLVESAPADGSPSAYVLCIVEDITARRVAEAALLRQTLHDPLTGLPNRALLRDRLAEATATGGTAGLLFCDLDGFKEVNDTFGHPAGDAALKAIAGRLDMRVRPVDTLARVGGDEFAVVCPGVSTLAELRKVGSRLLEAFELPIAEDGTDSFPIGMSIGMVLVRPGTDIETALARADAAMYDAKRAGRNTIRAYRDAGASEGTASLLRDLRTALRDEQFTLHAQPIVELGSGAVVAVEMLLRWQHPERGLTAPGDFLPTLESSTLMVPVGRWVLREACRAGAAWHRTHGAKAPEVHVNIAADQLEQPDFVAEVVTALDDSGLPAGKLVLEITETKMPRLDRLHVLGLDELRRRGVRLAMDDVGTGYAGLSQFTELPLDLVKLDQRFVAQLGNDPRCDAVMRAVLGLSDALGLTAIAEGVETAAQAAILRAAGYRTAQGYLFGRPAPVTDALPVATPLETRAAG